MAAPERVLNKVDAIEIPAGQLNITGLTSDLTKTVNIADFLPDGVRLADSSFDGRVTVFIGIRKTAEDTEEEEY